MTDIGKFVEELMAAGCMPKVAAKVVSEVFAAGVRSGPFRDETAEKRRAYDRARKAKKRTSAESGGIPVDKTPVQRLWTEGLALLRSLGAADGYARSNIGQWLKHGHDPTRIFDLIAEANRKGTGEPVGWVTRGLGNGKAGANGKGSRSNAAVADDLIARSEAAARTIDLDPADYRDGGAQGGSGPDFELAKRQAR